MPASCLSSSTFRFFEADRVGLIYAPPVSGSRVETGLLIQTSLGRAGGLGAFRTKRSGDVGKLR